MRHGALFTGQFMSSLHVLVKSVPVSSLKSASNAGKTNRVNEHKSGLIGLKQTFAASAPGLKVY